jgi:pyruvate formate lyase activating enzyme
MWIFDIKRFAVHDGPGIRTTVFMKGCPLQCKWCHNPESRSIKPFTVKTARRLNGKALPGTRTYGEEIGEAELTDLLLRDRHFYEASGGGVTFSGGEPLFQPDALESALRLCREHGLHTAVDTCGHAGKDGFMKILEYTDLFLYDLKLLDPELHRKYTGVQNDLILGNLDDLLQSGARVILRIPVIPGINTTLEEKGRFLSFIGERKSLLEEVHLLPYHRIASGKYKRLGLSSGTEELEEPSAEFMDELKLKFEATGLPVNIGG